MAFIVWPYLCHSTDVLRGEFRLSHFLKTKAPITSVKVKNIYPHDSRAFTQGLFFYQGYFYESTGLRGKSFLLKKEVKTGKIVREIRIAREYFGEGIALFKKNIYQLTWQNEKVFIYDILSFQEVGTMKYRGEGWGLTSDGRHLIMSNGSSILAYHDPETFGLVRKVEVHDGDTPVTYLNELEFIQGKIWAHIYMQDLIVRISPKDGRVEGWIDLSALRSYLPAKAQVDVLNGLAYDSATGRIFVTGKYWPKVFEIQLSE